MISRIMYYVLYLAHVPCFYRAGDWVNYFIGNGVLRGDPLMESTIVLNKLWWLHKAAGMESISELFFMKYGAN